MNKRDRSGRPALMAGVALAGLVLGTGTANAQASLDVNSPRLALGGLELEKHGATGLERDQFETDPHKDRSGVTTAFETYNGQESVRNDPQIVISVPGTPTTARDPVNINGIGQMIVSTPGAGGGVSLGLCTGTLINPRAVLFAAHCVNSRPATDYGSGSGGVAIAFGFNNANNTTQPGQPAGTSPLRNWLFGTAGRAANTTSAREYFYTVNGLVYNPLSLEPDAESFLFGDVAIASLDTPASDIPTWALLLSALTPPQITAQNGTGYHVTVTGYGANGIGTTGATGGIDYRRRVAENWLGALTSLDVVDTVLFGGSAGNLPQNLYWIDFDDPRRGTAAASPFDFNLFRDNPLPREGTTSGGNSGGPLILDRTFAEQVVIGVLSGGSRFFNAQPGSSYGTASFYQPLYLYWDWIAENNPYRYVGAKTGNGNWEDANHWVSLQDPNYRIIGADGQLVTGVPTAPGEENAGESGQFGQICIQGPAAGSFVQGCTDLSTGDFIATPGGIGAANGTATGGSALKSDIGTATMTPEGALTGGSTQTGSEATPTAAAAPVLPAPTIANGLPGASNFVPNNTNGNRLGGVLPRYFDVTLSNAGTTTLGSNVTIDRLTLRGLAGLNIAAAGSLRSLIDITQAGGMMNVNGTLTTAGDYTILSGLLQGSGTINAPFVNSIAGTISPGTMGTTGTLSINGNLVMASGTQFLVDVAGTASDRIAVTGEANVGGLVALSAGAAGQVNGLGREFTILTATNGVSGAFTAQRLSAILNQSFTYQANAVVLKIEAASYNTVIDSNSSVQRAYAQLFDQNRPNAALASLYGLDFATADTIRSTFSNLAPVNEQAVRSLSAQAVNLLQNFYDIRLREADKDNAGGKIAVTGAPLDIAHASLSPFGQPIGAGALAMQGGTEETQMVDANLPENVAMYLAGGIVSGDADSLPGYTAGTDVAGQFIARTTDISGYYLAGGLEFYPGEKTMVGISGYYSSLEADVPLDQRVDSETYAATLYIRHALTEGPVVDGQFTMGNMGFDTRRNVQFLGATQNLTSSSDDLLVSGALGLSYDFDTGIGKISPGIEGRYASVDLTTVRESGGALGLSLEREKFESKQARAGFDWETQAKVVQINATAQYVHEFEDGPQLIAANFVQGTGPNANFVLDQADSNWVEVGFSAQVGRGPVQFGIGFDTTIGRDSANARAFRASATYRF